MTETNHASEAAASSPKNQLQAKAAYALPDELGLQDIVRNVLGYYSATMQAMAAEILRMRRYCPPTAEVEKMRAELATAKDDAKRLRDEKRDQIAATVEHLRRAGIIVGSPTAGPTPGVAISEPMTLASTIGMLCDERAKILAGLGREAKALLEASFMLRCAEGGRPLPVPRVEEAFGIFEALRKVIAKRDALASERDAWKHKADTLGGDLNRIRSLVPTASDEQTTFDAVKAYLTKVHKERDASSKALFDVAIALEEADGGRSGTDENGPPRIRAIATARDIAQRDANELRLAVDTLRAQVANAEREYLRFGSPKLDGGIVAGMRDLANEVEGLRSAGFREAVMAFDTFLRRCGVKMSRLEGLMPVRWVIEAAKLLKDAWPRTADNVRKALIEEAQTAIAAMRDVGPELAKAGIQVGPRLSHAEAIAQLRGERDRWREKCEAAHQLADEAARFEGAVVADLATHGFFAAGGLGGVRFAVGKALTELARLRKESKRDQVAKQQALLDEIARLLPGKGPLLERVKHAAKMVEQDAIAERLCKELDINPEKVWLEAMRKSQPKRDVALAPIKGFVDEAIRKVVDRASKDGGLPAFGDPFGLFARRSLPTKEKIPGDWCGTNRPETPPLEPKPDLGDALNFGLKYPRSQPKVGPATGQPRTEVPVGPDGSGTVLELGEAFRDAMRMASPTSRLLPLWDETAPEARYRFLHTAVAELAKVVERIGAR